MELLLSAISTGGLVGAANQYLCLLILAVAARFNLVSLSPQMSFISNYWFIAAAAIFWVITIAPAYASLLSPGVMNTINTISNFISGFIVPLSSAFLALAAIGVISGMHPELQKFFETMNFFNTEGNLGGTSYFVAAASGVTATALTGLKALAKPVISTSTGTAVTVSAPIYATLENVASLILMVLAYFLSKINPWLLVVLLALVIILVVGLVVYALIKLKQLKRGVGKVLSLTESNPKAGFSIIGEFFFWGTGWLIYRYWARGGLMLLFYAIWWLIFLIVQPMFVALFSFFPPILPVMGLISIVFLLFVFFIFGLSSSRSLLKEMEHIENAAQNA